LWSLSTLVWAVTLSACSSSSAPSRRPTATSTPSATVQTLSAQLHRVATGVTTPPIDQAASATATLSYNSAGHYLSVHVAALRLPPRSMHAVHIHMGSCVAPGAIVHALPDLTVGPSGAADLTDTVVAVGNPPPPKGLYVDVHACSSAELDATPGASHAVSQVILCDDVWGVTEGFAYVLSENLPGAYYP
jgi:hypothetical protein